MNTNLKEGLELAGELSTQSTNTNVEVVICPPFTHLVAISQVIDGTDIALGAQNMYWEESGAFTGEISPTMLMSVGCSYIIIGHSERRQLFGETDEAVNKKVQSALSHELKPIIAVGETLEEREQNKTQQKITNQINAALKSIASLENIVFAYEPIWAIGTGKTATPEQANDVIRHIRALIGSLYSPDQAKETRILYGGSVTAENIDSLMAEPDIDGALVGGASLKADSFARIVNFE